MVSVEMKATEMLCPRCGGEVGDGNHEGPDGTAYIVGETVRCTASPRNLHLAPGGVPTIASVLHVLRTLGTETHATLYDVLVQLARLGVPGAREHAAAEQSALDAAARATRGEPQPNRAKRRADAKHLRLVAKKEPS